MDDQAIQQLDELLTQSASLLGQLDASTWQQATEDWLVVLRTSGMGLREVAEADPTGTDPTLSHRRWVYQKQIAGISAQVDTRLVPRLAELVQQTPTEPLQALLEALRTRPSLAYTARVGVEQVDEAVRGIDLLRTLNTPGVLEVLASGEDSFKTIRLQIACMGTYKALHDQLHNLQFGYFNFLEGHIARMASRSDVSDEDFEDVRRYSELIVDQIVEPSRAVATRGGLRLAEMAWIGELQQACELLAQGANARTFDTLRRALDAVDHVIATRSAALNTKLVTVAEQLALQSLKQALDRVIQRLPADAAEDQVRALQASASAVDEMREGLERLLDEHDTWQDVDRELREIAASLALDRSRFARSWPQQHIRVQELSAGSTEAWATALRTVDAPKLTAAIESNGAFDGARLARAFGDYRLHAGKGFFQLDKDVLDACEALARLDQPLQVLLGQIQSTAARSAR